MTVTRVPGLLYITHICDDAFASDVATKMKRTWLIAASCLCGLAFAGAALLESTRHADNMQYGLFSTSTAAQTPKLKLWPLDGLDVATFLICAVCLSLAGGAGIGGGAVLVPCFILVRGAEPSRVTRHREGCIASFTI